MTSEKRRSISTGVVLSVSVLLSLLFLMYAFVQKSEADKQFERAELQRIQADQCANEMNLIRIKFEKTKGELEYTLRRWEEKQKQETR